ncbi:MOSC domain-containing protein [Kosmotoga pacifica]|uniref:Molybdenum cofactor sulfurase n=1 Tax=Kosmotoga pacifica TaxID=1330330 RepID=A0A0G2Z7V9_9BACT|nr:MOSC domain-containing protein [Kosmotoga pacifica]AKI97637.1 molybdenum cofactor sulfurase [Kosmotoga pacifica]
MRGSILSINISRKKGTKKEPVRKAVLIENYGIEGDAHAGDWHRQVSMLALSSIEKMRAVGLQIGFGDFAENLTVKGVTLHELPLGTRVRIGKAVLEVTQIGKKCHNGCEISRQTGICVMPLEGIFLRVIKGGEISVGDSVIFEISEKNVAVIK